MSKFERKYPNLVRSLTTEPDCPPFSTASARAVADNTAAREASDDDKLELMLKKLLRSLLSDA